MKRVVVGLLFLALSVDAFFPNRLTSINIGTATLTHEDITEIGILKAVAHYFEDNPRPGNNIAPGSLVEMDGISAVKLFTAYYGAESNAKKLQVAIDNIATHNSEAYQYFNSKASWNWNGEMIKEANGLLTSIREDIIKTLKLKEDHFDRAYELIGHYLHILQMFYSNTNWVELFGSRAYYSLGISGKPLYAQASLDMMTCKNCGALGDKACNGTLIDNGQVLTSGYRSGQNIRKPDRDARQFSDGKCSHGGRFDTTSTTEAATGGINKESTRESLSPHFYLHQQAAQAAINHTTFFFNDKVYGLRHIIDQDRYNRFLQTKSGNSLVFVVDYTGSMSEDIEAVKSQIIKIIHNHLGTPQEPSEYVFVLFNDPENLTKVYKTEHSNAAINYVGNIIVEGGGDCPEYCLSGILTALKISFHPVIYVFTDADPKDYYKYPLVHKLAEEKKAPVWFFLTGTCGTRRRRNVDTRRERRDIALPTGIDVYKNLAGSTGGSVYETDKGGISKLANIISEVAVTSPVTILKREVDPGSGDIHIQVDNTITQLTLDITGTGSTSLNEKIYNPAGDLQTVNKTVTDLGVGKLIKITSPAPGNWTLSGLNSDSWNVDVTALSTLEINTKFVRLDPSTGFEFQITGRPIAGQKTTIILTVPSADLIGSMDYIQVIGADDTELARYGNFTVIPGRAGSSLYRTQFELPLKQFQVALWGKDSAGNVFRRLHSRKIVPVAIQLDLMPVYETLYIEESVAITFTVTNEGDAPSSITVTIEDDRNFSQVPTSLVYQLDQHEQATGNFTVKSGSTPNILVTATITATAKSSTGDNSQFGIRRLSTKQRIIKPEDNINPVCTITTMSGSCDETMVDPCVCSQYNWTATTEISDEGFGLYQVTSSASGNEWFTLGAFTEGQTVQNGTVKASVTGTCCSRLIYINVVDMASNTGRCELNPSPGIEVSSTECKQKPDGEEEFSRHTLTVIAAISSTSAVLVCGLIATTAYVIFKAKKGKVTEFQTTETKEIYHFEYQNSPNKFDARLGTR